MLVYWYKYVHVIIERVKDSATAVLDHSPNVQMRKWIRDCLVYIYDGIKEIPGNWAIDNMAFIFVRFQVSYLFN